MGGGVVSLGDMSDRVRAATPPHPALSPAKAGARVVCSQFGWPVSPVKLWSSSAKVRLSGAGAAPALAVSI